LTKEIVFKASSNLYLFGSSFKSKISVLGKNILSKKHKNKTQKSSADISVKFQLHMEGLKEVAEA